MAEYYHLEGGDQLQLNEPVKEIKKKSKKKKKKSKKKKVKKAQKEIKQPIGADDFESLG